ncbi:MAG: DUF533 domain-containing protein [Gammaproteobacteria bacterium]|nr:MAG: DUF533 domain-containing protein [Gammaproteobacteria bacterium]
MSLGKTLLKVAIGVAIVKGVTALTKGGGAAAEPSGGTTTAGRGTRYDGQTKGGLEDILGQVLGGGSKTSTGRTSGTGDQGGLGDLLDQISGQKRQSPRATAPKGGLDDLLGELTGRGRTTEQNRPQQPRRSGTGGSFDGGSGGGVGDLLDQVMSDRKPGGPITLPEPEREQELSAALMLRAVIQAVKCDGELDDDERQRLMQAMGEADQREVQAVQAELNRPVDVVGLARSVPAGLEPQVYLVSLMAINLDQKAEAEYLHKLAGELDLSPDQVNAIHDKAGAPRLYR